MKTIVSLTVNGEPRELAVAPEATLLDVLRDDLQLTGAKRGCNYGVCGTCAVLIDGRPARACLCLAADFPGAEVRTIEGLRDAPLWQALTSAFAAEGAVQCGYCTPGLLVTLLGLLPEEPHPSGDRVRGWIAGNVCRCTGYVKIVDAVLRATQAPGPAQGGPE